MAKHSSTFPDEGESEQSRPQEEGNGQRTDSPKPDEKGASGKHTPAAIEQMGAKAASGKHAPDVSFPSFLKGRHADEKASFSADARKYSAKSRVARRRKTSIIVSASIVVAGSAIGVGLLAASHHLDTHATVDGSTASNESAANDEQYNEAEVGDAIVILGMGATSPGATPPIVAEDEESGEPAGRDSEATDQGSGATGQGSGAANQAIIPYDQGNVSDRDAELAQNFYDAMTTEEGQTPTDSGSPGGSVEAGLDRFESHEVTAEELASLSDKAEPFAFALGTKDTASPQLSDESLKDLKAAIDAAGADQTSCLLVDLQTGRGIAANLDVQTYGASSFKGPFCAYLCESADAGDLDISGVTDSIEASIRYSDNDSYDGLRSQFESDGLARWLESCGISDDEQLSRDWYPFQSARESAQIWLHVNDYLESGSDDAKWLSELLGDTNTSFIRNAIGEDGVTVRDKGGWYAATWDDMNTWNGTCDAGIITCNGHTYLMSVMTGQPNTGEAESNVEAIALALWEARADLANEPDA